MKNKKAYISIEATFAITAILIFFSLVIGFFGFMVPRMYLEKEVQVIAQQVKINGGLTAQQYDDAMRVLEKYGSDVEILIYSTADPVTQLTNVAPKETQHNACIDPSMYTPFARRSDGEKLVVKVNVVLVNQQLLNTLRSVGITLLDNNYSVYETVLSERNRC